MAWTDAQRRVWNRVLAVTNSLDARVAALERLAPLAPKFQEMIRELILRHQSAKQQAEIALAMDSD